MARKQTFKRRPNKAGTVVKLSGKRRRPYCAKITTGKDIITGRQKQEPIGYYETWEEADDALTLYRLSQKKSISDQEVEGMAPDTYQQLVEHREKNMPTFKEIFDIIYQEELCELSESTAKGHRSWIKHFKTIWDVKITKITLADLQDLFDKDKTSYDTKIKMKGLCSKVFKYAVIHQFISRDNNYTEYIRCGKAKESIKHYAFSNNEIESLINNGSDAAKIVLIYIFTGLRVSELLNIPKNDIHLDSVTPYIVTGSKTDAGRNRVVPLHSYIEPFVAKLITKKGLRIIDCSYHHFLNHVFTPLMDELKMNHTPHDTRDTFATLCNENKVDIFIRKRVLGHKMKDITFDTYTSTVIETLYKEISKIEVPEP